MSNRKTTRRRAAATAVLAVAATAALAAGGSLDTGFGSGGAVTLNAVAAGTFFSTAVQADGKVVAVGRDDSTPNGSGGSIGKWLVARFTAAGALDTTFASPNGYRTLFGASGSDAARGVAIDSSGRIDVCGWVWKSSTDQDFGVVRLTAGGTFDTSFGSGGVVTTNLQSVPGSKKGTYVNSTDQANSLVVESGGQIVVAGSSRGPGFNIALVRYNANGALDSTFGTGGIALHGMTAIGTATSVAADGGGGYACLWHLSASLLVHFAHSGTYDTAFGQRDIGADFAGGGGSALMNSLAVQSDGRILVAGGMSLVTPPAPAYAMFVRYNANGTPDRSYGQNGRAIAGVAATFGNGAALQPDGNAVLAMTLTDGAGYHGMVARFDATGVLDTSFGAGGIGDPVAGFYYQSVALDSSGRIVAAGTNSTAGRPAVARYLGN